MPHPLAFTGGGTTLEGLGAVRNSPLRTCCSAFHIRYRYSRAVSRPLLASSQLRPMSANSYRRGAGGPAVRAFRNDEPG